MGEHTTTAPQMRVSIADRFRIRAHWGGCELAHSRSRNCGTYRGRESSQPLVRQGGPSLRQRSRSPPQNRLSTFIVPNKFLPEYTLRKPGTQESEDRAFPIPGFLVSSAVSPVANPPSVDCREAAFYTERSLSGVVETYP